MGPILWPNVPLPLYVPQVITTSPKYDWSILLANIGGQLGLCMGFSLITALELIELLVDLVCHVTRGVRERSKVNTSTHDVKLFFKRNELSMG